MRDPGERRREGRRRVRAAAAGGEQRKRPRLRNTATTAGRWRETDDDLDELADGKRSKQHYISVVRSDVTAFIRVCQTVFRLTGKQLAGKEGGGRVRLSLSLPFFLTLFLSHISAIFCHG